MFDTMLDLLKSSELLADYEISQTDTLYYGDVPSLDTDEGMCALSQTSAGSPTQICPREEHSVIVGDIFSEI
jgi:hypothetical protein